MFFYQVALQKQRFNFVVGDYPVGHPYVFHELLGLYVGKVVSEILFDPVFQVFCLTDVDDFSVFVKVHIHSRAVGQFFQFFFKFRG